MNAIPKPRILFLCDKKGWAFDTVARNLVFHLSNKYQFTIKYIKDIPEINEDHYDIIYLFFWGERYHKKFVKSKFKIVKEISSHRWEEEKEYGRHTSLEALDRYMIDAGALVCTSERLFNRFTKIHTPVYHYPLGIDTSVYTLGSKKEGKLRIGWAGNIKDKSKGVNEILIPATRGRYDFHTAEGNMSTREMVGFYQKIDVICVASLAEGTPLPLIEGMACGCFPVCCNVGVVSEIVEHQENGLIVNRTIKAFEEAFNWCENNLEYIRSISKKNSEYIHQYRSWKVSSEKFDDLLSSILENQKILMEEKLQEEKTDTYFSHFSRINPGGYSDKAYQSAKKYFQEDIEDLLPENKEARIIEIGSGFGHLLRYLLDKGYKRVSAVDLSSGLLSGVRERYADRLEDIILADAREYLPQHSNKYDFIVLMDVIEHVTLPEARELLMAAYKALRQGGKIVMRTPNMGNILGNYSLFQDITHEHGYTDWSIIDLLEQCGYSEAGTYQVHNFASRKRKRYAKINKYIHNYLYKINDRVAPKTVTKNLVAWGVK